MGSARQGLAVLLLVQTCADLRRLTQTCADLRMCFHHKVSVLDQILQESNEIKNSSMSGSYSTTYRFSNQIEYLTDFLYTLATPSLITRLKGL